MKVFILAAVAACLVFHAEADDVPGAMVVCESGRVNTDFCQDPNSMDACFNKPKTATFKNNFLMPPEVVTGFAKLNMGNVDNTRVNTLLDVTTTTLTVNFDCMLRSHCYAASVSYMACGFVDVTAWNQQNGK